MNNSNPQANMWIPYPTSGFNAVIHDKGIEGPRRLNRNLLALKRLSGRTSNASSVATFDKAIDEEFSVTTLEFVAQNWNIHEGLEEFKVADMVKLVCGIFDGIVTGVAHGQVEWSKIFPEISLDQFQLTTESRNVFGISQSIPLDAQNFCTQEGILEHLATALELVRKNFSLVQAPTLKFMVDPETKAEWVIIEFTARGDVAEVFENHRNYTKSWIASVPWPKRRKIRLEFDIKNGL